MAPVWLLGSNLYVLGTPCLIRVSVYLRALAMLTVLNMLTRLSMWFMVGALGHNLPAWPLGRWGSRVQTCSQPAMLIWTIPCPHHHHTVKGPGYEVLLERRTTHCLQNSTGRGQLDASARCLLVSALQTPLLCSFLSVSLHCNNLWPWIRQIIFFSFLWLSTVVLGLPNLTLFILSLIFLTLCGEQEVCFSIPGDC